MASICFILVFVFLSVHGFLLDKTQSTSGQLGTSNQYVTSLEFLDETKAIHLDSQQLRRYVDKSLAVLTSQLDNKFGFLEQKLVECENQSVPSHAYESLEQKFMDLQRKYENLERKYTYIQTLNNEYTLIKSQLLSVQNQTREISNDVIILKQHGNIKPLQEIQTLQQAVQTVYAQTHSLSVNERARSQDFLALYNMTIDSKRVLSELNTNTSNQFHNLEMKTDKQLLRLEQNHNLTTAGIISKLESIENQENNTMSVMQTQINQNLVRVAMTARPSRSRDISSGAIMQFDYVRYSAGITNVSAFESTGKFTCELEGLYIIAASVMSNTRGATYDIRLNGIQISMTFIGDHSADYYFTGAATVTRKLNPADQVWLQAVTSCHIYGNLYSKFSVIKVM